MIEKNRILVTGGCGFIGNHVVRELLDTGTTEVLNVDALTSVSVPEALAEVKANPNYLFEKFDLGVDPSLLELLNEFKPDSILHLAAESHVDRSIDDPEAFLNSNIIGTWRLLEATRRYLENNTLSLRASFRFVYVSTDEVYGSIDDGLTADVDSPHRPNSPYSASKAAGDHLVRAWHTTYDIPTITCHCSNNYGQWQFPDKLIPVVILAALQRSPIPVYGDGLQTRDWIHVRDHAAALKLILEKGNPGETYNISSGNELTNLEVVRHICRMVDGIQGEDPCEELIEFVPDRPGHDRRYSLDASRTRELLSWSPKVEFESGLRETVQWYVQNREWWEEIRRTRYDGRRIGLSES